MLLAALGMIFAGIVVADDTVFPLVTIDHPPNAIEKKCSDYFYSFETTYKEIVTARIVFAYKTPDGTTHLDVVPKTRIETQTAKSLTYQKKTIDGDEHTVFGLTDAEYQKAKGCLPAPEPETKTSP